MCTRNRACCKPYCQSVESASRLNLVGAPTIVPWVDGWMTPVLERSEEKEKEQEGERKEEQEDE